MYHFWKYCVFCWNKTLWYWLKARNSMRSLTIQTKKLTLTLKFVNAFFSVTRHWHDRHSSVIIIMIQQMVIHLFAGCLVYWHSSIYKYNLDQNKKKTFWLPYIYETNHVKHSLCFVLASVTWYYGTYVPLMPNAILDISHRLAPLLFVRPPLQPISFLCYQKNYGPIFCTHIEGVQSH